MNDASELTTALVLGLLQGLTEFLPVSSSGHIAMGAMLFDMQDAPLTLSIVLHAGTLLATVAVFRADVIALFGAAIAGLRKPSAFRETEAGRWALAVIVGTLPTVAIALALRDFVEPWSRQAAVVGMGLLGSAVAVVTTHFATRSSETADTLTLRVAVVVGMVQGLAVLPGLSRSGSTIAAAMLLGVPAAAAFRFSFLLSLPAVAGATVLELTRPGAFDGVPASVWIGGAMAAAVGLASLLVLRRVVMMGRFWAFALYLVPVGIAMIIWGMK